MVKPTFKEIDDITNVINSKCDIANKVIEIEKYIKNKELSLEVIKSYIDFFISLGLISDTSLIISKVLNYKSSLNIDKNELIVLAVIASLSQLAAIITNNIFKDEKKEIDSYKRIHNNIIQNEHINAAKYM